MVKRKLERKDGRVQRYNIKNLAKFKKEYYYNRSARVWKHKPKEEPVLVIKEEPTITEPVKEIWRMTLTINYVLHHKYYAFRLQRWDKSYDDLANEKNSAWKRLISALEKHIKYEKSMWWFPYQEGTAHIERRNDPQELIGKEEIVNEYLYMR